MTDLAASPRVAPSRPAARDDLNHVVCCHDDNLTLCGFDATHLPWAFNDDKACVVCLDLEGRPCPYGDTCPPEEAP